MPQFKGREAEAMRLATEYLSRQPADDARAPPPPQRQNDRQNDDDESTGSAVSLSALASAEEAERDHAAFSLAASRPDVARALIQLLATEKSPDVLASALSNLAMHEVGDAAPAARRLLRHRSPAVRIDALRLLGAALRDAESKPLISAMADDEAAPAAVRREARAALAAFTQAEYEDRVGGLLADGADGAELDLPTLDGDENDAFDVDDLMPRHVSPTDDVSAALGGDGPNSTGREAAPRRARQPRASEAADEATLKFSRSVPDLDARGDAQRHRHRSRAGPDADAYGDREPPDREPRDASKQRSLRDREPHDSKHREPREASKQRAPREEPRASTERRGASVRAARDETKSTSLPQIGPPTRRSDRAMTS
ncbi:hypothetical protein M885DRAFT_539640 [Pelagophyceae sp. CCMP2097]|nr:hypothetical protein M885DRAFT_539640 [Pelagophyceae sp. CCMP2097]